MRLRQPHYAPRNWANSDPPSRRTDCQSVPQAAASSTYETTMKHTPEQERILILDFGSQYGQLIARRVREHNVFCQIVRHDLSATRIEALRPSGIILSGGPASVYGRGAPTCDPKIFDLNVPVLGICYGM